MILSLATLVFFTLGVREYYSDLARDISPETLATLESLGLSVGFYSSYRTSLLVFLTIGCCIAALIIVWHKSDDTVALLVAFTLIGLGANADTPLRAASRIDGLYYPVTFVMAMILASHLFTCYLLPDGKFPQKWMQFVAWFWSGWLVVSVFWKSFPVNLFNWSGNGFEIYLYSLLAVLCTGIYAQVYRYTHTDSLTKRQQLKWVVFGIVVAVLIAVGSDIFIEFFEKTNPSSGSKLLVDLVKQTLSVLAQLSVPAAMVFSILRYRLYDIELVINRSLIYGLLIIFLTVVFGGILAGLQSLFHAITGNQNPPTLGIVAATVAVFSLFNPTLKISRNFVNRKIFGIEFDFNGVKRQNAKLEKAAHLPVHTVTGLGEYTGLELIARGGMGEVYKARHPTLNRTLAIKVLSEYFKDDSDFNQRFAREAEMMTQLRHPNIITIYDYGQQDGLPYIVMEYLSGETLSNILKTRGCLALEESLPLLRDLASALDYAHEQGIVHRDIKASNVIVEPLTTASRGRTQRAVLMDFGIARFTGERTKLTMTGDMMGTADYISPEQIQGVADLDGRTDQYSLGVLAYWMVAGKKPFERNNTWAMIKSHLEEPPPDPRELVLIPDLAARAIMRALAKKPEERFASAGEFIEALGN
jgi:tRNA A-37 threonylcarbamoyl transferase component Bud32